MSTRPHFAVTRSAVTWFARSWSATAIVVTALALGSVATGLGNSDRIVASSFASALKTSATPTFHPAPAFHPDTSARSGSGLVQLSGSEEFWLDVGTPAAGTVPVALADPLRLGDQVTFTSAGRERRLEVIDIRPIGDVTPGGPGSAAAAPLMLVTCRDLAARDAHPVRFVIEKDETLAGGLRRAPRAL